MATAAVASRRRGGRRGSIGMARPGETRQQARLRMQRETVAQRAALDGKIASATEAEKLAVQRAVAAVEAERMAQKEEAEAIQARRRADVEIAEAVAAQLAAAREQQEAQEAERKADAEAAEAEAAELAAQVEQAEVEEAAQLLAKEENDLLLAEEVLAAEVATLTGRSTLPDGAPACCYAEGGGVGRVDHGWVVPVAVA
jgi:hypothetical protein